jgi:hypothetical protein
VTTMAANVRAEPKRRVDQDGSGRCRYITNPFQIQAGRPRLPAATRGAFARNSTAIPNPGRRAGDRPVDAGDRDESRSLDACPQCGRDDCGSHLSGVDCAGFGSSGGEDRRRRFGSEQRWLSRFSGPAGSPRLERMYYDRASPSSLFRTNFLIPLSCVAGAGTACRSHSPSDTAKIVPTDAENPFP